MRGRERERGSEKESREWIAQDGGVEEISYLEGKADDLVDLRAKHLCASVLHNAPAQSHTKLDWTV